MPRGSNRHGEHPAALATGDQSGNRRAVTHGAGYAGRVDSPRAPRAVIELANQIAEKYLDGAIPAQLLRPEFMPAVKSWSRREARAAILSDYLEGLTVEEMISPTRAGAVKSVFEIWLSAEHSAAKARKDLGLDPSSWASIQKDLGIAGRNADDRLAQLGQAGAAIRQRHQATVTVLRPEDDG
ncbi:MAG TPA: hypothetical protein VLW50_21900 [Streptosporangiaceae bacterium]|nr:hypothetical protein [Streptosporangiaceae bacterium]